MVSGQTTVFAMAGSKQEKSSERAIVSLARYHWPVYVGWIKLILSPILYGALALLCAHPLPLPLDWPPASPFVVLKVDCVLVVDAITDLAIQCRGASLRSFKYANAPAKARLVSSSQRPGYHLAIERAIRASHSPVRPVSHCCVHLLLREPADWLAARSSAEI